MNAIAWLRKLGYGSTGLKFRNEFINLEVLKVSSPSIVPRLPNRADT